MAQNFPMNFANFLRTPFLHNFSGGHLIFILQQKKTFTSKLKRLTNSAYRPVKTLNGTRYSKMDQVKFLEDSL